MELTAATLQGVYTALVTPFRDGAIDEKAFLALIEAQAAAGVAGIAPVGTTGESPTVSHKEHLRLIELAVVGAQGRVQVIAGTGSNSTAEAIDLSRGAERLGADGLLLVAPYYNKPSQDGLFAHFSAIADAVRIPIVLYSIPGRCGVEIGVETTARLAASKRNIIGIKEAGGSADRVSQLRQALPETFAILSGDDGLTLAFLAAGATGVISVASNLIPREMNALVAAFRAGRVAEAEALHRRFYPLFRDLFVETNPIPVKHALAWRGMIDAELRLPLLPLSGPARARLERTLQALGL